MSPIGQGTVRREIHGWSIRHDPALASLARTRGWWLDTTIAEAASKLNRDEPQRVLAIDGPHHLTVAKLYADALQLANAMRRQRLRAGDVVSFMLPNWHESCVVYLAASIAGLVVNPLVTAYRNAELKFMLDDCRSRLIFIPSSFRKHDYVQMLSEVCRTLPQAPQVVVLRGDAGPFVSYDEFRASGEVTEDFAPVDPDSVRMVLYSSGTTGRPKGVLHTHNSLNADIMQLHERWGCDAHARFFIPSPVSHIGGSIYAFEMPLLFRVTAVLLDVWDAERAVETVDRAQCTHTAGATPFLQQILSAAKRRGSRLPSMELFICGGASVPPSLVREATEWFEKCVVTRVYGSTEVPTITVGSVKPGDLAHAADTDGEIGYAEVKLTDVNNGEGEIWARAPQMLVGYLRQEDEAGAFDADGFFRSGDLGRIQDGKYIVISGRKKDLIIRHGENISPKEVEDVLLLHPDIAEVAIVGIPSERTGEMACAFLVPRNDAQLTVSSVGEFLSARTVARYKFPERVELRESLPKNATGKVLKHQLRSELIESDQRTGERSIRA